MGPNEMGAFCDGRMGILTFDPPTKIPVQAKLGRGTLEDQGDGWSGLPAGWVLSLRSQAISRFDRWLMSVMGIWRHL